MDHHVGNLGCTEEQTAPGHEEFVFHSHCPYAYVRGWEGRGVLCSCKVKTKTGLPYFVAPPGPNRDSERISTDKASSLH